ncbi:MAG: lipid-A-disaccharide synthase N-terminal domain-containing protein [Flavobacteriaceae bacterium]|nr:lipid-A-disaccharide synthase N-terminal domain-containing protein [Flavobacteriaceae bacterium]
MFFWLFPVVILAFYFNNGLNDIEILFNNPSIPKALLFFGIVGHLIFSSRFIFQWVVLEKTRLAELPKGFWWISLFGAIMILVYGIIRKDPVLIFAQSFGTFIYLRNLKLIFYNAKLC